jgi:hypothetical protein
MQDAELFAHQARLRAVDEPHAIRESLIRRRANDHPHGATRQSPASVGHSHIADGDDLRPGRNDSLHRGRVADHATGRAMSRRSAGDTPAGKVAMATTLMVRVRVVYSLRTFAAFE